MIFRYRFICDPRSERLNTGFGRCRNIADRGIVRGEGTLSGGGTEQDSDTSRSTAMRGSGYISLATSQSISKHRGNINAHQVQGVDDVDRH